MIYLTTHTPTTSKPSAMAECMAYAGLIFVSFAIGLVMGWLG